MSTGIVRVCSWNLCIYPPIPTQGNKHTVLTNSLYLQIAMRDTLRERGEGRYHIYSVIYFHWHKYLIRSNIKGLSSLKHLKTKLREWTTRKNRRKDKEYRTAFNISSSEYWLNFLLFALRLLTDHVIWGPMRGLKKAHGEGTYKHTNRCMHT